MSWILLTLFIAVSYGAYNFFIKLSSSHINQIAGAVILQLVALLAGIGALAFLKLKNNPILVTREGVMHAVCAGIFVGLAEILTFYFFSTGSSASRGIPIIIGGSIMFGALFGLVFLRERLGISDWAGVFLILAGVILLTMQEKFH
jgi:transporter family protein